MTPERIAELRKRAERFLLVGNAAGISCEVSIPSAELLDLLVTAEREAKLREAAIHAVDAMEYYGDEPRLVRAVVQLDLALKDGET